MNECGRKPNTIMGDKHSEFFKTSMKSWLQRNDIEMHSTHNEGKSVVAEIFIRTLKIKILQNMTLKSEKCVF